MAWPGCYGSRLTGAGFGGCIVALVDPAHTDGFEAHLTAAFQARFGRAPTLELYRGDAGPRELD